MPELDLSQCVAAVKSENDIGELVCGITEHPSRCCSQKSSHLLSAGGGQKYEGVFPQQQQGHHASTHADKSAVVPM